MIWRHVLVFVSPLVWLGLSEGSGVAGTVGPSVEVPTLVLKGTGDSELAPHGEGNVYAPCVLVEGKLYRMWYGGQGKDGHDRIHYAESLDGETWVRNDFPPDAPVKDVPKSSTSRRSVGYATSTDGVRFTRHGPEPVLGNDAGGVDVKRFAPNVAGASRSSAESPLGTARRRRRAKP